MYILDSAVEALEHGWKPLPPTTAAGLAMTQKYMPTIARGPCPAFGYVSRSSEIAQERSGRDVVQKEHQVPMSTAVRCAAFWGGGG